MLFSDSHTFLRIIFNFFNFHNIKYFTYSRQKLDSSKPFMKRHKHNRLNYVDTIIGNDTRLAYWEIYRN